MKKVVLLLIISIFLITGCSVKKTEEVTDAEIFAAEYAISTKNVFKYATIDEVFDILNGGTGIIFFGNPDQEGCLEAVKIFSKLVDKHKISEVYYYDPSLIISDNSSEYHKLLDLLKGNLDIAEDEEMILNVPAVYFIRNGELIGYNDNVSEIESTEELGENFQDELERRYLNLIEEYIGKEEDIQ